MLLRKQFIADVRNNLAAQLDNIDLVNADGTVENLGEKRAENGGNGDSRRYS